MKLMTKYFGEIEMSPAEIIHFPDALYGFDEIHDYILINFEADNDSLLCMQAVNNPHLAFILLNPFDVEPTYSPKVELEDMQIIKANKDDGVLFYVITVIRENGDITVNLKSPIIINPENRLAKQTILDNSTYLMRYPVTFNKRQEE